MFMVSVKVTRRKVLLCALVLVMVMTLGYVGIRNSSDDSITTTAKPAVETVNEKGKAKKIVVKNNDQRLAFAKAFGWEVEKEAVEVMEVIIPKEFDEVYTNYNSIQKKQGCDLTAYSGKRCKRYSYKVINYPGVTTEVRMNILVFENKVIGGDVCSLETGGFMHGFESPQ